jgi:hypothetical protein
MASTVPLGRLKETMDNIPERQLANKALKQTERGGVLEHFILSVLSIAIIISVAMFLARHTGAF